jgi:hypothetical protein
VSASEKLKTLEQSVAAGGDFDSRPCDTAQNDAGWSLTEALPQIIAVLEAAELSVTVTENWRLGDALTALEESLS